MQITTAGRWFFDDGGLALPIAAVGALLAASLLYTTIPFMVLLGIPLCFYFLTRPFELLVFTAFMIPFNFVFVLGGLPVAAELLKVLLWGPFVLQLAASKREFVVSRYHLPFLVISTLLLYSCVVAGNLPFVLKESLRMGSSIALCYVAVNLIDTKQKLFVVLESIGISSFILAIYGLYQFAIQDFGALFWLVNPRISTSLSPTRDLVYEWRNRIPSFLSGEMEAGEYFNYCIPLAGALFLSAKDRGGRIFWISTFILLLVGLLLTFTFGAWTAFAAALVYTAWKLRRLVSSRTIVLLIGGVILASCGLIAANVDLMRNRIAQIAFDVWTRWDFWTVAWNEFLAHPVFGGGLGSFGPIVAAAKLEWLERMAPDLADTTSPHNVYMYTLSQFGMVGFLCIWGVFIHAIRTTVRIGLRQAGKEFRWIALGLGFSLCTLMVAAITDDSTLFGPHTSSLIWLVVGLTEVVARLLAPVQGLVKP
ncbi:MAG: O-antigen ligase family protein [Candidatus Sulfotelmatobacter sp.]